ncbi:MAG: transcriptional repressor [Alphaproteobacteria bacterium]|nr:transcriptional repressor [Alphaproteobacteria bacterium]
MKSAYEDLLKAHSLSLTSVRLAVLEALGRQPHADAATIFESVQSRITTASKQAIYNNLNTLVEHGLIREIKPKGQPSLYETRIGDNHHHIVCRSCSHIVDANCHGDMPCLSPVDAHGFSIDEAEVIFWGLCPSCRKNQK